MAKYSTGGSSDSTEGGACELCGTATDSLHAATIAGASLEVCDSCRPHDDRGPPGDGGRSGQARDRTGRNKQLAQQAARMADEASADPSHWVEHGTNYEDDQLPYLRSNYGELLQTARQEAGLTLEELAETIGAPIAGVEAVEQNRASRAGVGGSLVRAIEEELDIQLVEAT